MTIVLSPDSTPSQCRPRPPGWSESPAADTYKVPIPNFTCPWAAEFSLAYRSTTNTLAHKILAKGSITRADYAEVTPADHAAELVTQRFPFNIDFAAANTCISDPLSNGY